jgi:GNAT superfamily N-acetyltransferase
MAVHQELVPLVWTLANDAEARYREHLANMMRDENRRVLVAEQEGGVIGYVVVEKSARPPVLAHSDYGVFEEICVAPCARRAGVGRALVSAGVEWSGRNGLCVAQVAYATENPMSVPFWEGLGFRPYQITAVRSVEPGW